MFQFGRFPSLYLCIQYRISALLADRFPHSDIHGSSLVCSFPWLFAAFYVLLRLLVLRHSPYALFLFDFLFILFSLFFFITILLTRR